MKDPAILLYTSDFLTGTLTMTDEQIGKYIKLLCLQHQKGGYLTEKDMLNICKTYDDDVFSKFIKLGDKYYNERMLNEINKRKSYSESRSKNRAGKGKKKKKICKTYVNHMENENINIIEYLNKKCNTHYKVTTPKTLNLIKSRLKENFTIDDFKKVIDIKSSQWLRDPEMNKFLRPETLFGNKFESYLNEKQIQRRGCDLTNYKYEDGGVK